MSDLKRWWDNYDGNDKYNYLLHHECPKLKFLLRVGQALAVTKPRQGHLNCKYKSGPQSRVAC